MVLLLCDKKCIFVTFTIQKECEMSLPLRSFQWRISFNILWVFMGIVLQFERRFNWFIVSYHFSTLDGAKCQAFNSLLMCKIDETENAKNEGRKSWKNQLSTVWNDINDTPERRSCSYLEHPVFSERHFFLPSKILSIGLAMRCAHSGLKVCIVHFGDSTNIITLFTFPIALCVCTCFCVWVWVCVLMLYVLCLSSGALTSENMHMRRVDDDNVLIQHLYRQTVTHQRMNGCCERSVRAEACTICVSTHWQWLHKLNKNVCNGSSSFQYIS